MGWSSCGTDSRGRPIGYAHAGTCDHPGCTVKIDRGLAYACGGMHGTSPGCEGYFCEEHRTYRHIPEEQDARSVCLKCAAELDEIKAEDFREVLTAIAGGHEPVYDVKKSIYEVLLNWGETDDLPPDDRFCTPAEMRLLEERQEVKKMYSKKAADRAAGEGTTT